MKLVPLVVIAILFVSTTAGHSKSKDRVVFVRDGHIILGQSPLPSYPYEAIRQHWSGHGLITLSVRADGTVYDAKVAKSTGYEILDREAVRAFKKWRFRSEKSSFTLTVPCNFEFRKGVTKSFVEGRPTSKQERDQLKRKFQDLGN